VTVQVFVRDSDAMIAAPVQCDVDGIPNWSHDAKVPSMEQPCKDSPRSYRRRPAGSPDPRAHGRLTANRQRFRVRDAARERVAFADPLLPDFALRLTRSGKRFDPVSRFHSSNVSFEILPSTSNCANFRRCAWLLNGMPPPTGRSSGGSNSCHYDTQQNAPWPSRCAGARLTSARNGCPPRSTHNGPRFAFAVGLRSVRSGRVVVASRAAADRRRSRQPKNACHACDIGPPPRRHARTERPPATVRGVPQVVKEPPQHGSNWRTEWLRPTP
jgi:hypothetical protein